jgi:hypothetical protein
MEENLWGLVNNASGPGTGSLQESSVDDFITAFNQSFIMAAVRRLAADYVRQTQHLLHT